MPQIAFDSVPDAIKLPKDLYLGEASGVAVNSKGHVFVFSRGNTNGPAYAAAAAQLLEFDADGRFVREIGKNLYARSVVRPQLLVHRQGLDPRRQDGRKQEASDEDTAPLKHPKPPLPAEDGRCQGTSDLGSAGNIFVTTATSPRPSQDDK